MRILEPELTRVVILAGGKGTRLGSASQFTPKPMVPIHGRPFVSWVIETWRQSGFKKFTLLISHLADVFESYPWSATFPDCAITTLRDASLSGTGGAVAHFFRVTPDCETALLLNGDTFLDARIAFSLIPDDDLIHYFAFKELPMNDARKNLSVLGRKICENNGNPLLFDSGAIFVHRDGVIASDSKFPCSTNELFLPCVRAGMAGYSLITGQCFDIGTPTRLANFCTFLSIHK